MRNNRLENEILQRVDELVQCAISVSLKDETSRAEQLARGITMVQEMGDLLLEVLEGREQHLQALLEQLVAQRLPDRRILQSFGNFPRDIQHIISEGITSYLKSGVPGKTAPAAAKSSESTPEDGVPLPPVAGALEATVPPVPCEAAGPSPPDTPEQPIDKAGDQTAPEATTGATPAPDPIAVPGEPVPVPEPEEIPAAGIAPAEEEGQGKEENTIVATSPQTTPAAATADPPSQAMEALRLALLQAYPEEEVIINYEIRGGKIPYFLPRLQLGFEPAGLRHDWRHNFYCRRQGISIRQVAADELANPAYLARRLRREATWRHRN